MIRKGLDYIKYLYKFAIRKKTIVFYLMLLGVYLLMLLLNTHSPYLTDDYCSAFCEGKRIQNLGDWVHSLVHHYMTWGGGLICTGINMFFMMYEKWIWNIINSFVFTLFIFILYVHIVGSFRAIKPAVLCIILFVIFQMIPAFGENFIWVVGASAYLWCPTIGFSYLLLSRFQLDRSSSIINSPFLNIVIGVCGIFAAWTIETLGVTLCALFFISWLLQKRVYKWQIVGFLGNILGACGQLLAPGVSVRKGDTKLFEFGTLIRHAFDVTLELFDITTFLPFVLILGLYFFIKKECNKPVVFACAGMLLSHFAMIAAPYYPDRVKVVPIAFGLICIGQIIMRLITLYPEIKKIYHSLVLVLAISIFQSLYVAKGDIRYFEIDHLNRIAYIEQEKKKGNMDVVVDPPYVSSSKYCVGYHSNVLDVDPDNWVNNKYAPFYGIRSIRVKSAH